ncbi:M56 family metallopeptidase [Paucibacter sp. DJ2R-2]|uniref:M56 family metallopeptidase n=1 Tax=Paucibacter sp. DJ2R-2 TaxID=2893558 RepID=UPI0021E3FD82|nr:M56 family metallopeptidase [Paucibacter sp. DJ2R-2]MCV2421275.1 hypothetical protein [Paucibacter sp. DJ4R-1]MCV2441270.1 hypothetical protein [Paucibacter sp. DJ2R-2]
MTEAQDLSSVSTWLLHGLGVQTLMLSGVVLLLWLLRPAMLWLLGAGASYAAWLALPLVLLAQALPSSEAWSPTVVLRLKAQALGTWSEALPAWAGLPEGAAAGASLGLPAWLCLIWLLGTLLCLGLLALRHAQLLRRLRFDATTGCWRSPAGTGPALVGLLRPRLCLAEDFEACFSPAEQALILAHEGVHLSRRDNLSQLLASLLCCLHWFNPLAWWGLRRLRADQELACDARVLLQQPRSALALYASALLKAQDLQSLTPNSHGSTLACSWQAQHPLLERVHMLKDHHRLPQWRRRLALALTLGLSLGSAGLVHALKPTPAPVATKPTVPPVQEGYHLVETDVDLSVNGELRRALRVTSYQSKSNFFFSKKAGEKTEEDVWMIRLEPTTMADDKFRLDLVILRSDSSVPYASGEDWHGNLRVVAKPALIVKAGEPARIEVNDDKDGQVLRLDINSHWVVAESLTILKQVIDRPQP